MKNLFILTLLVAYLIPCFGQDHEVVIQPNQEIKIAYVYDELTQQTVYEFTSYNYGYWAEEVQYDPPKYKWYNAHTALRFNLPSLPTGAYNISVKLEAFRGSYSAGDSRVVEVPDNLLFYDYANIWYYAQIGNEYFVVDRSSGQLHDITSLYQSKIGQGYINFGIRQYQSGGYERGYVTMSMHIYYDLPVSITAQNNFPAGKIYVDTAEKDAPWTFSKTVGQSATLKAKEQNDNLGYLRIWNDIEAPNAKSRWEKNGSDVGSGIEKNFIVAKSDDGSIYEAGLRKNYLINRINQTEFDGNQTLSGYIVEQNSGQISTYGNGYQPGSISYNFAGWTDDLSAYYTRTISPNDNKTYTAMYKYVNHSNSTSAYSSNSQKKLVRTTDGWLHKVYESMNKVWYEASTDNGATWTVKNNGKPLSSNDAKSPAIDHYGNEVIIVWQEKLSDDLYKIRLAHYNRPSSQLIFYDVWEDIISPPYSFNAMPVISWANYKLLVVWRDQYGINYRYGYADCYSPTTWYGSGYPFYEVTGTDQYSTNPTLCIRKDGGSTVFHLGWQQSTTAIKYASLTPDAGNNLVQSTIETPSSGDGFNYRVNPSISIKSDGYPTIVYIGSIYQGATTQVTRRPRSSSTWGTFGKYGSSVSSPTEYDNIIVWSESNANKLYRPWGGLRTLSTVGNSVQMSNGTSKYAIAYRQFSPYDFQTSPELLSLAKENSIVNQCGREAIVSKGDADFYLILADVTAGSEVIKFSDVIDDLVITNLEELNQSLVTNSFDVTENTNFTFSLAYGTVDSIKAIESLSDGTNIQFNIELIDANTNEILGAFENIIFNSNNINTYRDQTYNVNLQGIGVKTVKMRVVTNTNFIGEYNLADIVTEESVLGKNNSKEIKLTGESIVNTYDLLQNYPNPFNPATNIVYQLPKDGFVTIKVYDVLGNEIKTLVNEQKATGRYEISFDASEFSSGVYIYKIQANDFVSSKKMMLIK